MSLQWICLILCFSVCCSEFAEAASNSMAISDNGLKANIQKCITETTIIPGGDYPSPYIINTPNTEYVLGGDITADGTAIAIRASNIILNLNGKTVTYNQVTPGEGVTIDTYNKSFIAITNGKIFQGSAMSEGDVYGGGNNPIRSKGSSGLYIGNIHARYGGRDVSGFKLQYVAHCLIEDNVLEDVWLNGTMKNRHQGVDAIQATDINNIVRNNKIINARQRGIAIGNHGKVYGNTISVNSLTTNSFGIFGYKAQNVMVYNNSITGIGEHPIGIGFVSAGTSDIEIYGNRIEVQTTRLGEEYGGSKGCSNPATPCGNYAVGFRTTWGGNNINFHDNTIIVRTNSRFPGTYSPTGKPVVVNGKGRGLMVGINAGETSKFSNNSISVHDSDGAGKAFGISCTGGNLGNMTFAGNTVTSNVLNVALSDEYGACGEYPLFIRNTFIKADNYPVYRTVAAEHAGYFEGTARFVSNLYRSGASETNIAINAAGKGRQSVYFGREVTATFSDGSGHSPLGGVLVTLHNEGTPFDVAATTDPFGRANLLVYDYEVHDSNNTSNVTLKRNLPAHTMKAVIGAETYTARLETEATASNPTGKGSTSRPNLYLNQRPVAEKMLTISY